MVQTLEEEKGRGFRRWAVRVCGVTPPDFRPLTTHNFEGSSLQLILGGEAKILLVKKRTITKMVQEESEETIWIEQMAGRGKESTFADTELNFQGIRKFVCGKFRANIQSDKVLLSP